MFLILTAAFVGLSLVAMNTAQHELAVSGQFRGQVAALTDVLPEQERARRDTMGTRRHFSERPGPVTELGQRIDAGDVKGLSRQQADALASLESNLSGFRRTNEELLTTARAFKTQYDASELDNKIRRQSVPGLLPRGANGTADAIVKLVCSQ